MGFALMHDQDQDAIHALWRIADVRLSVARSRYAKALQNLRTTQLKLNELFGCQRTYAAQLAAEGSTISLTALTLRHAVLSKITEILKDIQEVTMELESARRQVEQSRLHCLACETKLHLLSELRDRTESEYQYALNGRMQRATDQEWMARGVGRRGG